MLLVRQQTVSPTRLGDVTGDLGALVSLASVAGSSGSITSWMQAQIARFNALPQVVQNIQAVIQTLTSAFTAAGVNPASVQGMSAAQTDLSSIAAQYPTVQAALGQLGVTLYPALAAGTFSVGTITALSAQGLDVLGTFNGMTTLFGFQQDAVTQLQLAAQHPALSAATQAAVQQALAKVTAPPAGNTLVGYLIVGGLAYFAWRVLRRAL